jgi:hypothetical protein
MKRAQSGSKRRKTLVFMAAVISRSINEEKCECITSGVDRKSRKVDMHKSY